MNKWIKVLSIVLIVAVALAVCSPVYAAKGGKGKGKAQGIRHKETGDGPYNGTVDPAEVRGDAGQGDHGRGDPEDRGQGSAHASCRAAQGEVDPLCEPEPPKYQPPEAPPTVEPPTVEPPEVQPPTYLPPEPPTVRVCFYSDGNAVEVSNAAENVSADPLAFEATVVVEDWDRACWDAGLGSIWYVLAWNAETGHAGTVYRVTVGQDAGNADLHNPLLYVEVNGVIAERISPPAPGLAY